MSKTYLVTGFSRAKGQYKLRFANNNYHVRHLKVIGETDILLIRLSEGLSKVNCARFMKDKPEFQSEECQEAIDRFISNNAR